MRMLSAARHNAVSSCVHQGSTGQQQAGSTCEGQTPNVLNKGDCPAHAVVVHKETLDLGKQLEKST